MTAAPRSSFVYVSIIRTTPEKLWAALTEDAFIRQYWFGSVVECAWKQGSPWKLMRADGRTVDSTGEVLEIDPPRRMVIRWQNEWHPEMKKEGASRCTFQLEPTGGAVKLTITHELDRPDSQLISSVSGGWPLVVSNLKSLLETGQVALETNPRHRADTRAPAAGG